MITDRDLRSKVWDQAEVRVSLSAYLTTSEIEPRGGWLPDCSPDDPLYRAFLEATGHTEECTASIKSSALTHDLIILLMEAKPERFEAEVLDLLSTGTFEQRLAATFAIGWNQGDDLIGRALERLTEECDRPLRQMLLGMIGQVD